MSDDLILEPGEIRDEPLAKLLGERYLAYALSTITSRALPDVRDGLKPVHRRILFAMRQLRLSSSGPFRKSAKVVGEVMGDFHPHGDSAIYDAMVRLAQDFAVRYPMVDGQGNFGNVDGDSPAAYRYTEARITRIAEAMLEGIDEDTVDFRPNYNGEKDEPVVLPAAFPNLLANGAQGIAVGMATSVPPHNVGEICDALSHLIKFPKATNDKLVELIPGPDFPTGGIIVEPRGAIAEAYKTGRGGFRVRARWEQEDLGRGKWQIIITEIPYQVQKAKLIARIAELINERKLPILDDVRDESTEDLRVVLEPKSRSVDPRMLMEMLFKMTELESRISLNMNVLDGGTVPRVMGLRDVLQASLTHRREVLQRRTRHRLGKIKHRLEILDGYLTVFLNIDEVIRVIREEDEPRQNLMKAFKLSEVQAEAVLNMRLRNLRKLEEFELRKERDQLRAEWAMLTALMASPDKQWRQVAGQIKDIGKQFGQATELGARRSVFAAAPVIEDVPMEAMVEKEPVTVLYSEKGWVRAVRGHASPDVVFKYKDGDRERFRFHAQTTDKLLMFATGGRFYTIDASKLPGGRGHGDPVRLVVELPDDQDVVALFAYRGARKLVVASTDGRGFVVNEDEVVAQTRTGKQVLSPARDAEARVVVLVDGDRIATVGENRKMLIFPITDLPEMARGKGVRLQRYKDGGLSDLATFDAATGVQWIDSSGRTFTVDEYREWEGARAAAGRLAPRGFPKNNRFKG